MTRSTAQPCPVVVYNSPTVLKLFKQTPHCLFYKKKNSIENMHFSVSSMISTLGLILSKAENLIIASLQIDINLHQEVIWSVSLEHLEGVLTLP